MHASGPFWGMHLFWWAFWIFAMVGIVWSFVHSYFLRHRAEYRLDKIEKQTVQKPLLSPQAR